MVAEAPRIERQVFLFSRIRKGAATARWISLWVSAKLEWEACRLLAGVAMGEQR
jgi:hypothetical protein